MREKCAHEAEPKMAEVRARSTVLRQEVGRLAGSCEFYTPQDWLGTSDVHGMAEWESQIEAAVCSRGTSKCGRDQGALHILRQKEGRVAGSCELHTPQDWLGTADMHGMAGWESQIEAAVCSRGPSKRGRGQRTLHILRQKVGRLAGSREFHTPQ